MLGSTGTTGERSPDRLGAATWAITDLMGYGLHRHAGSEGKTVVPDSDEIRDPTVVPWS